MGPWLLFAACAFWMGRVDGGTACNYPPQLWCSSAEIARACKAEKHCALRAAAQPPRKAAPVSISLFYESLCPACRSYLVLELIPTWLMLNDIMNVTLVPYGNARETKGPTKWEFDCQHGEDECLGNMMETCILHLLPDPLFHMLTIFCLESSIYVSRNLQTCMKLYFPHVPLDNITNCVNGELGNKLMHQNAQLTEGLKPPHDYVPWILVNGKHTEDLQKQAQESLFKLVCSLYEANPILPCQDPKSQASLPHFPRDTCLRM
ncbi:gamma-interferon-inducible lysosomal thiol reductase [Elgaria multicarinata webbii]|uniref:gamma-interferon-inducible lysosomal thiol reductase n=1 Tax=Elgaria multicarinata webbii TaxID=159646 RepID=UPI002FCCEAD2